MFFCDNGHNYTRSNADTINDEIGRAGYDVSESRARWFINAEGLVNPRQQLNRLGSIVDSSGPGGLGIMHDDVGEQNPPGPLSALGHDELYMGGMFQHHTSTGMVATLGMVWHDYANSTYYPHVCLAANNTGGFNVLVATASNTILNRFQTPGNTTYWRRVGDTGDIGYVHNIPHQFVEMHVQMSTGLIEVRWNGAEVLSVTTPDITNPADTATPPLINHADFLYANFTDSSEWWDWYVSDEGWAGPGACVDLYPNQDAGTNQWHPEDSNPHYESLNDADNFPALNSTDFLSSNTAGEIDEWEFDNLPSWVEDVVAVQLVVRTSSNDTESDDDFRLRMTENATLATSGAFTQADNPTLEHWYNFARTTAPDGSAWTPSKVNGMNAGIEKL